MTDRHKEAGSGRRRKILLVDDSTIELMMQNAILSRHTSYDLITASDGEEAFLKAHAELPDLILMDVTMPKANGFETCQAIRQSRRTAHIPVVLITNRRDEECVEEGFASGCTDYISKPVQPQELISLVRSYLGTDDTAETRGSLPESGITRDKEGPLWN